MKNNINKNTELMIVEGIHNGFMCTGIRCLTRQETYKEITEIRSWAKRHHTAKARKQDSLLTIRLPADMLGRKYVLQEINRKGSLATI